jgi:DNA polymerase-3 subunit alpha
MSRQLYRYKCGCSIPIREIRNGYKEPLFDFRYTDLTNESCPAVWDLYGKGITLGVFQLNTNLGRKYCRELKPESIEHIAALTAILRPGTLMNRNAAGKSLTQQYCDRKNGKEPVLIDPEALTPILSSTYGIMVYQEQQMRIAQELCGFSAGDSDEYIRKGIAKKKPEILTKAEKMFIEGAERLGKITKEDAEKIFDWLKKAARYSFNKSHSVVYGISSYKEAWLKTHVPLNFYVAKMKSPCNSQTREDVADLIYEAKQFGITTKLPDLRDCQDEFYTDGEDIFFGLSNIKGFGQATFNKMKEMFPKFEGFKSEHPFFDFCINATRYFTQSGTELLIESGACDFFNLSREQMIAEFRLATDLTTTEQDKLFKHYDATRAGVFE